MCKGSTCGESQLIFRDHIHESIRDRYTKDIDVDLCIHYEVWMLLRNGVATKGHSCCGHGKIQSHAFIFEDSIERAQELGYKVVVINHGNWDKDRLEYAVLLYQGTQGYSLVSDFLHKEESK